MIRVCLDAFLPAYSACSIFFFFFFRTQLLCICVISCRDWTPFKRTQAVIKGAQKHTHPSFRPLQRAGWGDIGSWSRTRQCYSSQLPARSTKRERETHYDYDLRHCGCGQDSQTLLRADRIQFIISGKINGPLFLQYFQRISLSLSHTHKSREIWSFDHLFLWHFASLFLSLHSFV